MSSSPYSVKKIRNYLKNQKINQEESNLKITPPHIPNKKKLYFIEKKIISPYICKGHFTQFYNSIHQKLLKLLSVLRKQQILVLKNILKEKERGKTREKTHPAIPTPHEQKKN